mmetsp:Transcript_29780/g.58492  ORF Transcript_29780/g.58492 Transcript_29780/m.58492 type:complete len:160 (-) Transcript_29780:6-485(-)
MLRKNCNSFSMCALFFLTGRQFDTKYRMMEQMGKYADEHIGLIRAVSDYVPNPKAVAFNVEAIIDRIKFAREGTGQHGKVQESYRIGQPIEVYSATFETWVGARVQTIHQDGEVTVVYNGQKCRKTVSAADLPTIIRPFQGGNQDRWATVCHTPCPLVG